MLFELCYKGVGQGIALQGALFTGNGAALPEGLEVDMVASIVLEAMDGQDRRFQSYGEGKRTERERCRFTEKVALKATTVADGYPVGGDGDEFTCPDFIAQVHGGSDVEIRHLQQLHLRVTIVMCQYFVELGGVERVLEHCEAESGAAFRQGLADLEVAEMGDQDYGALLAVQ